MDITFKQRLSAKNYAEKALGLKPNFTCKEPPVNISEEVRSVEYIIKYLIDNVDRIKKIAVITEENGVVDTRWSKMDQSKLLYLSKSLDIDVDETLRNGIY